MGAITQHDDPAEFHVDGGGEQGRGDQDEHDLDDVWAQCPVGRLMRRDSAADVSDPFNCNAGQPWDGLIGFGAYTEASYE